MTPDLLLTTTARKMLEQAQTITAEAKGAEYGTPYKTMMDARSMALMDAARCILDALNDAGFKPDGSDDDDQDDGDGSTETPPTG